MIETRAVNWEISSGGSTLGAQAPQILPRPPKFLDTVVLLLVELIGSIVISLSSCCLPNDEGPGPQIFFLEPPLEISAIEIFANLL